MHRKTLLFFAILIFLPSLLFAQKQVAIGTPLSMLQDLQKSRTRSNSIYNFKTDKLNNIPTTIVDYFYKNGYLAMTGKVVESDSSICMLKGDNKELYGWVVLIDKNRAYEYTTNDVGEVVVEEVPVTKIIPICKVQDPDDINGVYNLRGESRFGDLPHLGTYPSGTDVTKLQSLPGATKVMYLDVTRLVNGSTPIAPVTNSHIWQTWQSTSSALISFKINVTTDASVYSAALANNVKNTGIARHLHETGRSFAPLFSFGTTSYSTLYRETNGYGQGRTAAHEIGHQLGLEHDGSSGQEYFPGLSSFKWVPIMGNYWSGNSWGNDALYQWSFGEYSGANNTQDDLDMINDYLPYKEDDYPTAMPLKITNGVTVDPKDNYACLEKRGDTEQFTFSISGSGGNANLLIDRIEYIGGSLLDIEAEILDGAGNSVAVSNTSVARYAKFDIDLDAGSYILEVRGGSEGTPSNGFSNYSSLGYFSIEGEITGAGMDTGIYISTPVADSKYEQGDKCSITWFDNIDENVKISLINSSTVIEIVTSTESDGNFDWLIPNTIAASNNNKIIITSVNDKNISDTSAAFEILEEYIVIDFPYTEKFDGLDTNSIVLPKGWIQNSDDDIDWLVWSGPTPSKVGVEPDVTGPNGDYPSGSGNFIYLEASGDNNPAKNAKITTPKFRLKDNYTLSYWCHMFSDKSEMGDLQMDIDVDGVVQSEVIHFTKDSGDIWFEVVQDLSGFQGDRVRIIFSATTGSSWASDIGIDNILIDKSTGVVKKNIDNNSLSLNQTGKNIRYYIPESFKNSTAKISIYNLTGQLVSTLFNGRAKTGINIVNLNTNKFSSGYYICKLSVKNSSTTIPILLK